MSESVLGAIAADTGNAVRQLRHVYRWQAYVAVCLAVTLATLNAVVIVGTLFWGTLVALVVGHFGARLGRDRETRHLLRRRVWGRIALTIALLVGVLARPNLLIVLVLVVLALFATTRLRHHGQTLRWLKIGAAEALHIEPGQIKVRECVWDGHVLLSGTLIYPGDTRDSDPARRRALTDAIAWRLRALGEYDCQFVPSSTMVCFTKVPPLPELLVDREWGKSLPGVVIGETFESSADAVSDLVPVRLWRPDTHLLIAGATRGGKTVLMRGLAVRGLTSGAYPGGLWLLDGKGAGDYAALHGREGVELVAHTPAEWAQALDRVLEVVRGRYALTLEWRKGNAAKPDLPRALVIIDEVQMLLAALDKAARAALDEIARTSLAANVTMVIGTQRPDAKDAVPGAVRDNIVDRIVVGRLSRDGAQMMLPDGLWQAVAAVDQDGKPIEDQPPGRAHVWIDGKLSPVQVPWLPQPSDDPDYEDLYPPKVARRGYDQGAEWAEHEMDLDPDSSTATRGGRAAAHSQAALKKATSADAERDDEDQVTSEQAAPSVPLQKAPAPGTAARRERRESD